MFPGPEKKFQRHIAQYLKRVNKYAVLEQAEITDTDHYFFRGVPISGPTRIQG